jgi:hypothetical protein
MSHTTDVVNLIMSPHTSIYPVSSTVPLYTVEEPDPRAPVRKLAAQTLHSSARLGSPDRRVGRCLEFWQLRETESGRVQSDLTRP